MTNDPISDMLIRIKNAGLAHRDMTSVPYSKLKFEVANILLKEGFIKSFSVKGKKIRKHIEIGIAYLEEGSVNMSPRIDDVARVSKLSRRVYLGAKDIKPVKQGRGLLVVSTPKGVLSGKDAKSANVGGEALFMIW
jgi:small subunit ribosomal protein S8